MTCSVSLTPDPLPKGEGSGSLLPLGEGLGMRVKIGLSLIWHDSFAGRPIMNGLLISLLTGGILCLSARAASAAKEENEVRSDLGTVEISVGENGNPVPARIRLLDIEGEPIVPEGAYGYHKSFVCEGSATFQAPAGDYRLIVSRGTEYLPFTGNVSIEAGKTYSITASMKRWVDMNSQGWYSGDFHVHRPVEAIPSLMLAEDLNLCAVQTLWNDRNLWKDKPRPESWLRKADDRHVYHVLSEEDERDGGAVILYNLQEPIDLTAKSKFFPSSLGFIENARRQGAWVEQEKPFWWESPVNVALGKAVSTELANNHFCEEWMLENEAWGRPRDAEKYPGQLGYALNCFDIYYRCLNAGFKLVATAGSATGVLPNPLGYNRCYVDCGGEFSYERWFERLAEGRNFVTNGPMLFVRAGEAGLGDVIPARLSEIEVSVEAVAATSIDRIELVADGRLAAEFRPESPSPRQEWQVVLPLQDVSWLAVRCFEPAENTIRFAHTSPVYVEGRTSPSRKEAAQFFVEWVDELISRAQDDPDRYESPERRDEILRQYREARRVYAEIAGG